MYGSVRVVYILILKWQSAKDAEYDHSLFASLVDNLSLKLSGTHNTHTLSVYLRVQFQ